MRSRTLVLRVGERDLRGEGVGDGGPRGDPQSPKGEGGRRLTGVCLYVYICIIYMYIYGIEGREKVERGRAL